MQCFAVITTESEQTLEVPDFGRIRAGKPLIFDDFKMVRLEAKRRCKFFEITMPVGIEVTLHVLADDEELKL